MSLRSSDKLVAVYRHIDRALSAEGVETDALKAMKIPYIAYGFHLGRCNEELFDDEIQAWQYGPVIENLYHDYNNNKDVLDTCALQYQLQAEEKESIDTVLRIYGNKKSFHLVDLTHTEGTPWSQAYRHGQKNPISKSDIRQHYEIILATAKVSVDIADVFVELSKT